MRRSTLLMCALLVIATSGCERVKAQVTPIRATVTATLNKTMTLIKDKIEYVRVRFFHKKPTAVAVQPPAPTTPEPAPEPAPAPPPPAPAHAKHPRTQVAPPSSDVPAPPPGVETQNTGPRDVPFSSPDTGTLVPGMSEREVYSMWGNPVATRHLGEFTYLYFQNGCEYSCGHLDVVTLENGQVTDAIVRWPGHGYAGQSTSPDATTPHAPPGGNILQVPDTAPSSTP